LWPSGQPPAARSADTSAKTRRFGRINLVLSWTPRPATLQDANGGSPVQGEPPMAPVACPHCGKIIHYPRADGRCPACGKPEPPPVPLRLPDDLRAFFAAGRQLAYDASQCEAGRVTLLPLDKLRVGKYLS